jgi:hypothetical protein
MWDYDENIMKEKDIKMYVYKKLIYGIWHWEKIEKKLVEKYIDDIDLDEHMKKLIYYILWKIDEKQFLE